MPPRKPDIDTADIEDVVDVKVPEETTTALTKIACPGYNCRTSIDIKRGQGLI